MTPIRTPLPFNKLSKTVHMYLDKVSGATVRGTADMFTIQPNQIRAWRKSKDQLMLNVEILVHDKVIQF
jgi:hypothetical protein